MSAPKLPKDLVVTANTIYIRFHGPTRWFYDPHSEEELSSWAQKIAGSNAHEAFIYFNNTADGSAIANARSLEKKFENGN